MKKATKKPTAKKAERKTASVEETDASTGIPEMDYPTFTDEAWAWMSNESIPKAFAPILYVGEAVPTEIASLQKRSISLEEAQILVQPDGDEQVCAAELEVFQPVRYVPFVSDSLRKELRAGKSLLQSQASLYYGGAFYVLKNNKLIAFKGSVYHFLEESGRYEHSHASSLVDAMKKLLILTGKQYWGKPREHAENLIAARDRNSKRRQKVELVAETIFIPKKMVRGEDAFRAARRGKDRRPTEAETSES